jgi:beta-mannosidase
LKVRTLRNLLATFALLLMMAHGAHSQTGTGGAGAHAKIRNLLTANWQFREAGKGDWHKASVPGCVHTDLLANKLIEDPFYRDNEQKLQ